MKQRPSIANTKTDVTHLDALAKACAALEGAEAVRAFLVDLCTPAELEALADRWRVVPLLVQGVPYRDIYERTGVSVTTVGRIARTLAQGEGGYAAALAATGQTESNHA